MKTIDELLNDFAIDSGFEDYLDYQNSLTLSDGEWMEICEKYAEQFKPKWISVKARLPEVKPFESIKLIVYGNWDDDSFAFYIDRHFYATDANDDDGNPTDITNLVTHWRYSFPPSDGEL